MAAAWRKVCGVTVFGTSDGQLRRAIAMCRETSRWNASALRRPPFELGKTGSSGFPPCCDNHSLRTAATSGRNGVASHLSTFSEAPDVSACAELHVLATK